MKVRELSRVDSQTFDNQLPFLQAAHSSSGLGHLPLKEETTGSNPVCATIVDKR